MAQQEFKSKIDRWIALVLVSAIVIDLAVVVQAVMWPASPAATTATIVICIAAIVLLVALLLRTYYTVNKGILKIVSGPFRWSIAIDQISSVTPTRSLWSSPALSLDRLLICYGKGRKILVSPADKNEFLRAIGHDGE
ncbi:MAG: PH domain-containing protein [Proteobacteria bacterium]|nr:PH domain-containing protein [Pseudomonadota bacterium]MDA1063066.1 PH domain-containing protein [Pseudomonadota bacterium]